MSYQPAPNPWKNIPLVGSLIDGIQNYLAGAAPLASPTFIGDPKAPTPTAGDNDASIATTAFVTNAVAARTPGKVTISSFSGGPPGSPSVGDVWIATGVADDLDGDNHWQFMYTGASPYPWSFIGGPELIKWSGFSTFVADGAWHVMSSYTVARAGYYKLRGTYGGNTGVGPNTHSIGYGLNGTMQIGVGNQTQSANWFYVIPGTDYFETAGAGDTVNLMYSMGTQSGELFQSYSFRLQARAVA